MSVPNLQGIQGTRMCKSLLLCQCRQKQQAGAVPPTAFSSPVVSTMLLTVNRRALLVLRRWAMPGPKPVRPDVIADTGGIIVVSR
jgi:hypothetical protein